VQIQLTGVQGGDDPDGSCNQIAKQMQPLAESSVCDSGTLTIVFR
jgi:hypothetical protein